MFTQEDQRQFTERGISSEQIQGQIQKIRGGSFPLEVTRPAVPGDGIKQLNTEEQKSMLDFWDKEKDAWCCEKFVPASGAASRMFKSLFAYMQGEDNRDAEEFFTRLKDFPFYNALKLKQPENRKEEEQLLRHLLTEEGLNWGQLAKGLLPFHKNTEGHCRSPLEEHLCESRSYLPLGQEGLKLHFTVSEDQKEAFISMAKAGEEEFSDTPFKITYSSQDPATDTIALDQKGEPFRLDEGELLFRPGGHGSLISNLNKRDSDIFFIKNIDNVQKEEMQLWTNQAYKTLAGILLHTRKRLQEMSDLWEDPEYTPDSRMMKQLQEDCGRQWDEAPDRKEVLNVLNSPIRVCGMVKNEGEPGGGPFWVRKDSRQSLQIVESAQIDLQNPRSKDVFDGSTHFNPVFMVCLKKNLKGETLDLRNYIDEDAFFIAEKSMQGRSLKALEHPGLWNGAMAKWISLFVEIPPQCFTPVKTVNDLLREAHR